MKTQLGFTLVETLIAGVLSTIVAGGLLTIFYVQKNVIAESTSSLWLNNQADIVTQEIIKQVHQSNFILKYVGEMPPAGTQDTTFVMYLQNSLGIFGGYKIDNGILKEYKGGTFNTFKVGPDSVFIDAGSYFTLNPTRNRMTIKFNFHFPYDSKSVLLQFPEVNVACHQF